MPDRILSDWLEAYTQYTEFSEAPKMFHFWTGVWTIAGAMRRRVWKDERFFQWTPNFYIVLVAPPGIATKSTTMRIGVKLLQQVKGVNFGPGSMTWQHLTEKFSESVEYLDLGNNKTLPISCLSVPVGELGTFLRPEDSQFMDVLTSMWDGQLEDWGRGTKQDGELTIKNPWLNIIGCTTPSWLKMNFPEHMIGGGLASRIIFVYAEQKKHFVAYPSQIIDGKDHQDLGEFLAADLKEIAQLKGEFNLTKDAYEWGGKWYQKLYTKRPSHLANDRYDGYVARKQGHLHKLAMIISAARGDSMLIDVPHLETADLLLKEAELDMNKVFSSIGGSDEGLRLDAICSILAVQGKLSNQDLWKQLLSRMSQQQYTDAIASGAASGKLKVSRSMGMNYLELVRD